MLKDFYHCSPFPFPCSLLYQVAEALPGAIGLEIALPLLVLIAKFDENTLLRSKFQLI
jgi:hypothetical protein